MRKTLLLWLIATVCLVIFLWTPANSTFWTWVMTTLGLVAIIFALLLDDEEPPAPHV